MTVKLGSIDINKLYLGSGEVKKAYLGNTLIYDKTVALWTPAQLGSALQLWLDALDVSSITKDGSNYVSQWADKSGNGNHAEQSEGTYQPLYDGNLDEIFFGTSGDVLNVDLSNGLDAIANGNNTAFAVGRENAVTGGWDPTTYIRGILEGSTRWGMWWLPQENMYQGKSGGSTSWSWAGNLSSKHIRGIIRNGTSLSLRQWDGQLTSGNDCVDVASLDSIVVGWKLGSLNEIVVTNTALSAADRQKLEGYFAHRWGITGGLSAGHPYKSSPPTV